MRLHTPPTLITELAQLLIPDFGPLNTKRNDPCAAVLIAFHGSPDTRLVFVEKAKHLRSHPGQVAFPGGTCEPTDDSFIATALREAQEEARIEPKEVTPLGFLPTQRSPRSGFYVAPAVAWWTTNSGPRLGDPNEIAAVHDIAIDDLLEPINRLTWGLPSGATGPAFVIDDLFIWGFTAGLLDALFDLTGWTIPWDHTNVMPVPPRFLTGE